MPSVQLDPSPPPQVAPPLAPPPGPNLISSDINAINRKSRSEIKAAYLRLETNGKRLVFTMAVPDKMLTTGYTFWSEITPHALRLVGDKNERPDEFTPILYVVRRGRERADTDALDAHIAENGLCPDPKVFRLFGDWGCRVQLVAILPPDETKGGADHG